MRPRKVAENESAPWGNVSKSIPNPPGGRRLRSSVTKTRVRTMSRLTVARIPVGSQSPWNSTPGASPGTAR